MHVKKLLASLPQRAYSATQVLDNEAKVAELQQITMTLLMEKAGLAAFSYIRETYPRLAKLLVMCGKGNNGGDGFVIARLAYELGIDVTVYLCADETQLKGDAKIAFERLASTHVTVIYLSELPLTEQFLVDNQYQLIVDAIFGIGFKGQLPIQLISLVSVVNQSAIPVLSVDVPSGLDATTGNVVGDAIVAQHTVTFIAVKQGLLTGQAARFIGELYLADLTLGDCFQELVSSTVAIQGTSLNSPASLPKNPLRLATSHKGSIGKLLELGGGKGHAGAIRLASEAALRAGASLVAVHCHPDNHQLVFQGRPELILVSENEQDRAHSVHLEQAKVLLIGPGLGQDLWAKTLFSAVISANKPCVLDADALRLLAKQPQHNEQWVLTPHPGEAAALLHCSVAEIEQNRFAAVKAIANQYGGVCVLKGAGSLVCYGDNIWINTSGNSGMASGGMGDVLSGIIAALLMQLAQPIDAVRLAVHIHGQAADNVARRSGKIGMLASDLFPEIQQLLNQESSSH